MKFADYSPPSMPSHDQQRDALQKGLGRASQWAATGQLDENLLLEACLQDQRFDTQLNSSRGDWLWQMVLAMGAAERFRVPVLHALCELSNDDGATQLCELAGYYAKAGDDAFRIRLYEIVEQKPFGEMPWIGEELIIALDGEPAFLFAAGVRGQSLAGRDWAWDDSNLVHMAFDHLGEETVSKLLDAAADESSSRFREQWRQNQRQSMNNEAAHPTAKRCERFRPMRS